MSEKQMDLRFDLRRGKELKEQGMAATLAAEHEEWKKEVIAIVTRLPSGFHFTSETIQQEATRLPHHVNCWGAMMRTLQSLQLCRGTNEIVTASKVSRHAAIVRVWVRC